MSDLQDALNDLIEDVEELRSYAEQNSAYLYEKWGLEESSNRIKDALRLVANPNIEAANETMRGLMPTDWEREPWPQAFVELIVAAALTPGDTE